jgi:single-strand DNA-binding protein
MAGLNKVQLIGRLGKDPEIRNLDNGVKVANVSIATSEQWKDKTTGQKKEVTEWHNLVLWRGLADVAEKYLKKGNQVFVEGKIRTRSWEKDGIKRYTTEIFVDDLIMLGGAPSGGQRSEQPQSAGPQTESDLPPTTQNFNSDDLPF